MNFNATWIAAGCGIIITTVSILTFLINLRNWWPLSYLEVSVGSGYGPKGEFVSIDVINSSRVEVEIQGFEFPYKKQPIILKGEPTRLQPCSLKPGQNHQFQFSGGDLSWSRIIIDSEYIVVKTDRGNASLVKTDQSSFYKKKMLFGSIIGFFKKIFAQ